MPKVNWKQLLTIGRSIAAGFVPGLEASIVAVENVVDAFKPSTPSTGAEKKARAIEAAQAIVFSVEGVAGRDILLDPKVVEATSDFVDVYVASMNAKAKLIAAIEAAKAARGISDPPQPPQ